MKKWILCLLSLLLVFSLLTACGGKDAAEEAPANEPAETQEETEAEEPAAEESAEEQKEEPEAEEPAEEQEEEPADSASVDFPAGKPITLIVPYAAGGGTDIGNRMLVPYLEKELDTTITVVNQPGGSGWVAWNELATKEPDGYTITAMGSASLNYNKYNPDAPQELGVDDFTQLGCQVVDYATICIRADETRFKTWDEFIEYGKENELTGSGAGTEDKVTKLYLNDAFGTNYTAVISGDGAAGALTAVLGGHVDFLVSNVGECLIPYQDGELIPLCVFSEERSPFLPDVPTYKELTGDSVLFFSARALATTGGLDPAIRQVLVDAIAAATQNQDFVDDMAEQGLLVQYMTPEEFTQLVKDEESVVLEYLDVLW